MTVAYAVQAFLWIVAMGALGLAVRPVLNRAFDVASRRGREDG